MPDLRKYRSRREESFAALAALLRISRLRQPGAIALSVLPILGGKLVGEIPFGRTYL
jgi:hypothetical protein